MSILRYVQIVQRDALPDPYGSLSGTLSPGVIQSANDRGSPDRLVPGDNAFFLVRLQLHLDSGVITILFNALCRGSGYKKKLQSAPTVKNPRIIRVIH